MNSHQFCCVTVAYPNALKRDYARWLSGAMSVIISEDMVGDTMERLKITHKHIKKVAIEQDPLRCVTVSHIAIVCLSDFGSSLIA